MKASAGRVLMLVENSYPADTRVRNEASTLVRNGYQVTVIALRSSGQARYEVIEGVVVYRLPRLTLFAKLPAQKPKGFRKILHNMRVLCGYAGEYGYFTSMCLGMSFYILMRHGFDVIHAHNPPDTLVIVSAFYKVLGKKSVFDHHDLCPELYLSRYKTKTEGTVTRTLHLFERLSVKCADAVIATNESYRSIDIGRNGADPARVFVVRNGPDLSRIAPVSPDRQLAAKAQMILGYVGAMNPQDGLDYLLRALHHLVHTLKRTDFYCVLIGSGDSLDGLRLETVRLGISEYVHFTGYIPDEDMIRYLSTADICLDPNPSSPLNDVSTWIKVMEYMALGKPVVSFDLKETRVSAGDAALFVKPNDEAEFAAAIQRLMDDPQLRHKMAAYGRKRVRESLSWQMSARNLLSAYGALFRSKSGPVVLAGTTHNSPNLVDGRFERLGGKPHS
jgi:glycosyltransferase involved in cell wall biosynthesis